jgi:hypothetical protein
MPVVISNLTPEVIYLFFYIALLRKPQWIFTKLLWYDL